MLGLMQDWPLLCHKILDHAAHQHPDVEIVSRSVEGPIVRSTYAQSRLRALKIAQLLEREGFGVGDRIATLAWNTGRQRCITRRQTARWRGEWEYSRRS